jgi:hypothetical protein
MAMLSIKIDFTENIFFLANLKLSVTPWASRHRLGVDPVIASGGQ